MALHSWIGPVGAMVPLKCPSSAPFTVEPVASVDTTLGGVDKTQIGPRPLRQWTFDLSTAHPSEVRTLLLAAERAHGDGPIAFLDPWAGGVNVLRPQWAMVGATRRGLSWSGDATASAGGALVPGVGRVRHALLSGGGAVFLADGTPVVPGRPLTLAVHLAGTGQATLSAREWAGSDHLRSTNATVSVDATLTAKHVIIPQVHDDATHATLAVNGARILALAQATWTDGPVPWEPGQQAASVLVTGVTTSPILALHGKRMFASQSATIRELRAD